MSGSAEKTRAEIGLLDYEQCQQSTLHGLTDLFTVASLYSTDRGGPALRVSHWRRTDDGAGIRRAFDTAPGGGTPAVLIVPGRITEPVSHDEAAPYAGWLRGLHAQGATLASVCAGAFILAETGLLAGRPATTHWYFTEKFRECFPDIRLDIDRILIDDGEILTAGGIMSWTDLGLRLVNRLLGPTVMADTAKFLLVDMSGREQRHYAQFSPRMTHGDEAILKVQHWLHSRAGRGVTVGAMAGEAGLEERTFLRRFKAATGLKPTQYAQHLRIGKAREQLEFTKRTVDQISFEVGYEDAAAFRRVFQQIVGLSASEYRQRFSVDARST